ncbi:MAG TPA: Gfo/Idh/MocA family oxidoreductase, partial [archaeon]|nr:Gfo/Idh/MocA family oxidoreductase [archaeon]
MKMGVIGAGYWGIKHIEEFAALGADIVAADLIDDNLKRAKEKFNARTTNDYHEILNDPEISGVTICTPNQTHYSICKEFLNAGKNVFVEKPLAMSAKECEELISLAKQKGLVLAVGHIFRFNNAVRRIKEMIERNEFGDVYIIKMKWTNLQPLFEDRDVIFDLAPHPFDIVNFLFSKYPDEISCVGNAYRRKQEPEAVFINGRLGRTIINIELSWLTPMKDRSMILIGSKKSAYVELTDQKVRIYEGEQLKELEIIQNNTIRDELNHF